MKKISVFVIFLCLSAIVTLIFIINDILNRLLGVETISRDGLSVSGKVQAVESGIVTLKDLNGRIFRVAPSDALKGIRQVIVRDVDGWFVSIEKIGGNTSPGLYGVKVPLKAEENILAESVKEV